MAGMAFRWASGLSTVMMILAIAMCGTAILGIVVYPLVYGGALTVAASEAICPSRRGTRYIVFSVALATMCIISFALTLAVRKIFNVAALYVCAYCISIVISAVISAKSNTDEPPKISGENKEAIDLVASYAKKNNMSVGEYIEYCKRVENQTQPNP